MNSDHKQLITDDGAILEQVPYMSQDHADMTASLDAAIAARAVLMSQLDDFTASVIRELEARAESYMREPLVGPHYAAAIDYLYRLREASKS